ncbi:hypothetical protein KAR91_18590, partial [Candidatus Pacearchaeota archaeon]|nr:hypothetical protein [Candidatus Pacearchaeota archaeon]
GTGIPGNLDIVELDGSPSGGSLTRNPIIPGSFKPLIQIPIDDVKNDFVLKYRMNYATGEFADALYMTNGGGVSGSVSTNLTEGNLENDQSLTELKKLCADSFNEIHSTNTLVIEAWAIRDEATAMKLLQAYIEWFTVRRYLCEFRTKRNAIQWELSDFFNLRTQDIIDQRSDERTERGKWKIIEISPTLMKMEWTIKGIQVD